MKQARPDPGEIVPGANERLLRIAHDYGTPAFVFFEQALVNSLELLRNSFAPKIPVRIHYSCKTNWLPAVLRAMCRLGLGVEVVSGFELWLARKCGFTDERILFNGPAKTAEEIKSALQPAIAGINIDSLAEAELLTGLDVAVRDSMSLGLRLCLDVEPALKDFGVNWMDRETIGGVVAVLRRKGLSLNSLHVHSGQRVHSPGVFNQICLRTADAAVELFRNHNVRVKRINLGGGFAQVLPGGYTDLSEMGRQIDSILCAKLLEATGEDLDEVILEPGRYLIDSAFVLLTQVAALKKGTDAPVAVLDAGVNVLGSPHDHAYRVDGSDRPVSAYRLKGPLCCPGDIVSITANLPCLEIGDVVAVANCGAYTVANSTQFIQTRPPVIFVNRDGAVSEVRRRETFEDMVALDDFASGAAA